MAGKGPGTRAAKLADAVPTIRSMDVVVSLKRASLSPTCACAPSPNPTKLLRFYSLTSACIYRKPPG